MGKDRPVFDATSDDRRRAFKFFIANFRDFCIMEDYVDPTKVVDSNEYWIAAKRPKVMAALRRAFPPAEWDVLTATIDAQIADEDKGHPARWLTQLSQHYLGEEPIIQSTHNFLRLLKQELGMSVQAWHTLVHLEYQKCSFSTQVDDRHQRDIFIIGLNETLIKIRSDVISREDMSTLTFTQVISKARDFEAGLNTESAITKHQLEEMVHKVPSAGNKTPHRLPRRQPHVQPSVISSSSCQWRGKATHSARRDCPAANATCHRCGKRGHWQQVCRSSSSANTVSESLEAHPVNSQSACVITQEVLHVHSTPKGIFVDLDLDPACSSPHRLRFQVDTGCSCNTIHTSDLQQLPQAKIEPSTVRLLDYSKNVIPTQGQTALHCTHRSKSNDIVVQVITAQTFYAPLLGLSDSTRMGILKYDVDTIQKLEATPSSTLPPLGELKFSSINLVHPYLFEGSRRTGRALFINS